MAKSQSKTKPAGNSQLGMAGGAAAGAAAGALLGPVGAAIGAVVGGVAGSRSGLALDTSALKGAKAKVVKPVTRAISKLAGPARNGKSSAHAKSSPVAKASARSPKAKATKSGASKKTGPKK